MEEKIKQIEEYLAFLESEYQVALQYEEDERVAFVEGKIDGVRYVLVVLKGEEV